MTEGSKKWFAGGRRMPPAVMVWLAAGMTLVVLGDVLLLVDSGFAGGKTWLRVASIAAEGLLASYFWASFVHRRRV
ncbi:hypothetical protein AB0F15_04390 [Amycolatopsis sp. NPDC026612]|uniref:hypothetical protein n=1 Tax=Amycolatopsis sp. NPDC026612 TaxID=3155466 RepID=UPI0033FCD6CB